MARDTNTLTGKLPTNLWKLISLGLLFIVIAFGIYTKSEPLLVVASLTPLLIYLTLRQAAILALIFAILTQYRLHEQVHLFNNIRVLFILAILLILGILIKIILKNVEYKWPTELTLLTVFFLLCILSAATSIDRVSSYDYLEGFAKLFLVTIVITWLLDNRQQLNAYCMLVMISGLILSLMAISHSLELKATADQVVRIGLENTIIGNQNDLAAVLLMPLGFSLVYTFQKSIPPSNRIIAAICLPIILLAILLTKSRGGFLGIAAMSTTFALYKIRSKTIVVCVLIAGLTTLYFAGGIYKRGSIASEWQSDESGITLRLNSWRAGLNMSIKNPLTGIGIGQSTPNYYSYAPVWDGHNRSIHNSYIEVMAEIGLPAFLIFTIMIFLLLKSNRLVLRRMLAIPNAKNNKPLTMLTCQSQAIQVSLCGTLVAALFINFAFFWTIYMIMAQSIALRYYVNKNIFHDDQAQYLNHTGQKTKLYAD